MSYGGKVTGSVGGAWAGRPAIAPNPTLFDHGLGRPQREIIQAGVVDLLARLRVDQGGYLQAIEPTDVVVRGVNDEEHLGLIYDQLQGRAPAILVATGDKDYTPVSTATHEWKGPISVHVYFFANSLRSRLSRLTGDAQSKASQIADPGLYVMMEHAEQLLIGERCTGNTSIKELRPVSEGSLGSDNEIAIWQQTYSVLVTRSIREKRDLALELKQINTYHRLSQQAPTDTPVVSTETDVEP